jgi:uncharacterized protein YjbI with pentapeptide repeats
MTNERQAAIDALFQKATMEEMLAYAGEHDLLTDRRIDLRGARVNVFFKGSDLRQFVFDEADLSGSSFVNCSGAGATFRGCTFANGRMEAAPGVKVSFEGASFERCSLTQMMIGPRTLDLRGVSFRGARMKQVIFRMGRLDGACFAEAHMDGVILRSAQLTGADFSDSSLSSCVLEKAALDGADLTGARLTDCLLEKASIEGAHLERLQLEGGRLGELERARHDSPVQSAAPKGQP